MKISTWCSDCGQEFRVRDIWIDDDALLCGFCAQVRRLKNARRNLQRDEDRRADEVSNTHDHVEGTVGEGR